MSDRQTIDRKNEIRRRYHTSLLVQFAIGAVFVCLLWFMSSTKKEPPVQIEHKVVPSETQSLKKEPTIENLLALKETLELSAKQVKELSNLKAEKDKKLKLIDKQLEIAVDDFDAFMSSRRKKRTHMSEIFSHSAPATNLGKRRRILIKSYSRQAMRLLSSQQSKLAYQLFPQPLP